MIDQLILGGFTSGAYFDVALSSIPLGPMGDPVGMSGRFTSVSGLGMQFEYETFQEGGSMYPRYFFKHAVPQTLVLEQGTVTTVDTFSNWLSLANMGMAITVGGSITLNNHQGIPMRVWNISGAHILRYVGPSLDSNNVQLAVSRIELMYGGCT